MRQLILSVLAGLCFIAPIAASGEDKPIPQDPKWEKKIYAEREAWNRKTLLGAYEKVGKKDPHWDKPARAALEAAARFFSNPIDKPIKIEEIYEPANRVIDAGCDDPLIFYLFARSSYEPNFPGERVVEERYEAAAEKLEKSAYPPIRRIVALQKAAAAMVARKNLSAEERKKVVRFIDAALALLPKSCKEDERNYDSENLQFQMPMDLILTLRQLNGDYQGAFDHVDAILAKSPELKAIRLQTRGDFLIRYGWEARGNGFANKVTEEGWKKFHERLSEARDVLNECWKIKPGDYRTANLMLAIEKGIGGERDEMEKWFERAMKACSFNKTACHQKLDWLDPKWHGSEEEMLAFGRACRDTKNWRAGITLLLAEAHMRASERRVKEELFKYMRSKEVCDDVQQVYEEYLKHYPDDFVERTRYAAFCFVNGRYVESDKQFKMVGEISVSFPRWPKDWLEQVRGYVAEQVAKEKQKAKK